MTDKRESPTPNLYDALPCREYGGLEAVIPMAQPPALDNRVADSVFMPLGPLPVVVVRGLGNGDEDPMLGTPLALGLKSSTQLILYGLFPFPLFRFRPFSNLF